MKLERLLVWKKRTVSMVPLIDVVFILLLFFMLSTSLMGAREISINFPAPYLELSVKETVVIRLENEQGLLTFNDRTYESTSKRGLTRLKADTKDAVIAIDTAPGITTQALITLLDRLKVAGIAKVSLLEEKA